MSLEKSIEMSEVRHFAGAQIKRGEHWLFSADFNIKDTKNPSRIDEELYDINKISEAGGIAVILADGGRHGKTRSLEFVADYISAQLGQKVQYYGKPMSDAVFSFIEKMKPGEIVLMGNTRENVGEELNSPELSYFFSHLGDFAVIGGFGKAHRRHSSNVGILDYRKGFLSTSQADEMRKLDDWKGSSASYSVAVLGGIKKEKIEVGLKGFAPIYDAIIPGGIVLNTILKCIYGNVGKSVIRDGDATFESDVKEVLSKYKDRIHIPMEVIVAKEVDGKFVDQKMINLGREKVPEDFHIISYRPPYSAELALQKVAKESGRLVVAGTPDIMLERADSASQRVAYWIERMENKALILGGDTAQELECKAVVSTGGGSALTYLTMGTTAVYEALRKNRVRFLQ